VIPLSFLLVVASAVTLGLGVFTTSDPLVWVSLASGLGAVALIAGSVVRRRRSVGPDAAAPERAGPAAAGTTPASVEVYGPSLPGPDTRTWPWTTAAPTGPQGWTGEVPDVVAPPPPPAPAPAPPPPPAPAPPEPVVEEGMETVPVRDALRVAQLADEVLVVDGQPRYHLAGCALLSGAQGVALAVSAARRGGFTPCSVCTPDRVLLDRARDRAAERANDER
jgi:hypothetical protein